MFYDFFGKYRKSQKQNKKKNLVIFLQTNNTKNILLIKVKSEKTRAVSSLKNYSSLVTNCFLSVCNMCAYTCRSVLPVSTSHCIDKNRNPLAISEKTDIAVEIGRGGPPNVQNTNQ